MTLTRFHQAQDHGDSFEHALAELRAGHKRGHWIWWVFPQLAGLGLSATSRTFGIADVAEAERYLDDPILRDRYLQALQAVHAHARRGVRLADLMSGELDAMKLVSSLTLFCLSERRRAALPESGDDPASVERAQVPVLAGEVLTLAGEQGLPPCWKTQALF